jgi:hypothetical protein
MRLELQFSKKQWLAMQYLMDEITTEIWYWWWAWGGKSYLWVMRVWMMASKYEWTRWFFWRKELTNLKRTTLNTYFKFLADYDIPDANKGKLNQQDNTIRFENWSEILLLDLAYQPSDPLYTRFWSLELTWGFIDESNEVDSQAIMILNTRCGRQNNTKHWLKPKILETFNPDKWHVYERYYKPYRDWVLQPYRQFIPALAIDNKHIDKNYIEQLEKADEITRQRLLYWNFDYDDNTGKLFRYDEISDLFTSNVEKKDWRYLICDVARLWNDTTFITYWEWLEQLKEYEYQWQTTDLTANVIRELESEYKVPRRNICIDSDWVWWWVADQLRWCTQFINNARAIQRAWETKNFSNLKTQCYFKLQELAEKRMVRLNMWWKHKDKLMQELSNILLKNENDQKIQLESKEDMKRRIWRSPDRADCVMMRMYYELRPATTNNTVIVSIDNNSVLF